MRSLFLAAAWLAMSVSPATAITLYVNNLAGNDRYNGQAESQTGETLGPVRTIRRALHLASLADRITLVDTGEPYRESLTFSGRHNSGLKEFPFIFEGNGATLEGAEPMPKGAWQSYSDYVFWFRPPGLGHQQLFRDARPLTRRQIFNAASGLPKLEELEWAMHGSRVYLRIEKDKIPRDYALTYAARRTGITLINVENVIIRNLTVQGFQIDGVNFHTADRNCTLLGVTARGNGRSGISVGPASRVAITECVVGSNGVAQLRTVGGGKAHLFASEIFADTAPLWEDRGGHLSIDGKDAREVAEEAKPKQPAEPPMQPVEPPKQPIEQDAQP
jgi:hypothetical protein